ncbi:hypothetical protein CMI44_00185 [Candidatus Pacearchaeota archaeon]|nr:hypothetical protein [Candidatus Pacearchaeota archaeon]
MKFPELQKYISLVLKLILIISIINSIYFQLWHLASTSIFLLILLFSPQIIKKSYRITTPIEFEFLLLLFIIISLIFGKVGGILTPILFGIATSFIGFMIMLILYSTNQIKKNYFLIILFAFNFAVAFGFGLEFIKYYLKLLLGHEITDGLYKYSMRNMSYVIIGTAISAVSGFIYMKKRKGFLRRVVKRFTKSNPELFSRTDFPEEVVRLVKEGENDKREFKSTLRVNIHTDEIDKKIEYAVLKTIASFLNTKGGTLLIGVSDSGEIRGLEKDRFENNDKLSLHLTNLMKEKIGKKYLPLINFQLILIEGKTIIKIECQKNDKPVFIKTPSGEEEFYIRAGPSSSQIKGSELVEYIDKKFGKKD